MNRGVDGLHVVDHVTLLHVFGRLPCMNSCASAVVRGTIRLAPTSAVGPVTFCSTVKQFELHFH
jgi:hypothetical protein